MLWNVVLVVDLILLVQACFLKFTREVVNQHFRGFKKVYCVILQTDSSINLCGEYFVLKSSPIVLPRVARGALLAEDGA